MTTETRDSGDSVNERTAEDVAVQESRGWLAGLDALHARSAHHFHRSEMRARARRYLAGLLAPLERTNGWQVAEHLGERGPHGVQRLLKAAGWDAEAVRDDLRGYVVAHLGAAEGVLGVDETGLLKKGTTSAGVARHYSGTAGRRENQQIGVFLAYASGHGYVFIDRALYLPETWAQDPARRAQVGFATKGALAGAMVARACAAGVPARWVVGDTVYGGDELRYWLAQEDRNDVLAVPCTHGIWTQGQQEEVQTVVAPLPAEAWGRLSAGDGSQGPRLYDGACLALPYAAASGRAHWLLVRRSLSDPTDLAYYRVYGPADTTVEEMVRVAGTRWTIEEGGEQAKEEVGLDQYEVRRYDAWYRHITLALLAHAYLTVPPRDRVSGRREKRGGSSASSADLIPLTVPEVRRLLCLLSAPEEQRPLRLHGSRWRRRHQAVARRAHVARRARQHPEPTARVPPVLSVPGTAALTDTRWTQLVPLLPAQKPPTGRPALDHRRVVEGMLWVMHTGAPWREMPAAYGPWQTIYGRYQRWAKAGIWALIVQVLHQADLPLPVSA